MDLWTEIDRLCALNSKRIEEMRRAGVAYAENEASYRVAVADATLGLKAQGMPATLIRDIVRGRPDIAKLKQRRDAAEVNYKAFQEEINVNKLRIRVLEGQLNREYGGIQ